MLNKNLITKIYEGIYIEKNKNIEKEILNNIENILKYLNLEARLSFKSALYLDKEIKMVGKKSKEINIQNLQIRIYKERKSDKNNIEIQNFYLNTKKSGWFRSILENYSKKEEDVEKIDKKEAKKQLKTMVYRKNGDIKDINNYFLKISKELGYEKEYLDVFEDLNVFKEEFNEIYENLDYFLIEKINIFCEELKNNNFIDINEKNDNINNLGFLESYFSNYIEGTKFSPQEAISIIYHNNKYIQHKDIHDITQHYKISVLNHKKPNNLNSFDDFKIFILNIHRELFKYSEKSYGEFKTKPNYVGNYEFIKPEKVELMLKYFFEKSKEFNGFKKAVFLKIAFIFIHPFEDGNGRVSRILLNNFLSLENKNRLIFPTVIREDYLLSLQALTYNNNPKPIIKFFNNLIKINNSIEYNLELEKLIKILEKNNAFSEKITDKWIFNPSKNKRKI